MGSPAQNSTKKGFTALKPDFGILNSFLIEETTLRRDVGFAACHRPFADSVDSEE
jgi:hypothetical protein